MPLIHVATLFHNTLKFQGEIWSMLIKGFKVVLYKKTSDLTPAYRMRVMVGSKQQEGHNFLDSNEEPKFHQISLLMAREQSSLFCKFILIALYYFFLFLKGGGYYQWNIIFYICKEVH